MPTGTSAPRALEKLSDTMSTDNRNHLIPIILEPRAMHTTIWSAAVGASLLLGMLMTLEFGFRRGRKVRARGGDLSDGVTAIEAAVFALLGLLLGFSFSGGTERLDARRMLIVQESNAIGTAYLLWICCRMPNNPKCGGFSASTWMRGLPRTKSCRT